jgi:mono/diheme cytochrome c family protein
MQRSEARGLQGTVSFATAWVGVLGLAGLASCGSSSSSTPAATPAQIADGMEIFRDETFGDEQFWTGTLQLNAVISAAIDPTTALSVGLKVDSDLVPADVLASADLTSPATTVALLKLGAVVGLKGTITTDAGGDHLTSIGITCAICHSTVDNSVAPGIGKRLDGYPNRDLDPGAIIALSPALTADQKAVYNSWGKGHYDPRYNVDGMSGPVLIPPAYGLAGAPSATYTGDGSVKYWNNYVAVVEMGGQGAFSESRLGVNKTLPAGTPDLVAPKLDDLVAYELSLAKPAPTAGSFDATAAGRGQTVFSANCASCHAGAEFTSAALYDPSATGMDPSYANRSATKKYRATPLRALAQHAPYFHDGSAATLADVADHYDQTLGLGLTDAQKSDLVAYLNSI